MLYSMNYLKGLPLLCHGEESGRCGDLYFEDGTWLLRHIVAEDGSFVFKKRSLVSPQSIDRVALASNPEALPLSISKSSFESAPDFDTELPFSRAVEMAALNHYHLAPYWMAHTMDGWSGLGVEQAAGETGPEKTLPKEDECNLRSMNEVIGYEVKNDKTSLGLATDLVLDLSDFTVAYLAVDTKPSERGGVRLIATQQKDVGLSIDFSEKCFRTKFSSYHLLESPSADLTEGRLTLGDQQKIDLSSY